MSAMLYKRDSATAREAVLRIGAPIDPAATLVPVGPSDQDRAIEQLEGRIRELSAELRNAQADLRDGLAEAREQAKADAAREHIADDERRLQALERSLAEATQQFEKSLTSQVEPLAARIAAKAFAQLVTLREGDEDWLAQVIARRLEGIASGSLVALHIAPDEPAAALAAALADRGARGVSLHLDAGLNPGSAKLVLTLGEVEIRPGDGAEAIVRLLETAGGELG